MIKFRDSIFSKMVVWLMLISITLVSCDPNGDLANNYRIDKEIEKQLEAMGSQYSAAEIETARVMLQKAKSYVLSKSKLGLVSRADVVNYLIDESIASGDIEGVSQEERDLFVETFSKDQFFLTDKETLDPMYGYLNHDGRVTTAERSYLESFEDRLMNLTTEAEVIDAFNDVKTEISNMGKLSSNFKKALEIGMNQGELAMVTAAIDKDTPLSSLGDNASEITSSDEVESRCTIEVCVTEYTWVIKVITVVIAVVAIVLAIFTFGFSLILVTATFAAWVLVPIVVCSFLPCPDTECPDGESLTCAPGFALGADNICFREGATWVGSGLFSEVDANGNCPDGGFFTGSGGNLDCALGPITSFSGGIFSGLVPGEDFWADDKGAYHEAVCR